ncbi:MAG TPA: hypothetical protein VE954_21875 [Oligoflexus sp.]|uniref:hypothetical protein n=1 Tax=Oligoflexus sp. TaxID=1971216 RepID=UPI002D3382B3|nr:hypothetical protein [Oligoflexus sp.]HYX35755.1 hypothetical protein [Oligoflexus sp.]
MSEKIELLAGYIERWIAANSRRNIALLSRLSGVPYPTIRRIMQKESVPNIETAMSILNTVATLQETISYFDDNASIQDFYARVTTNKELVTDPDTIGRLLKRESFWIIVLALTVGATASRVEKLLGTFGLSEFTAMIEEGFLHEESRDVYRTDSQRLLQYIESKKVGEEAAKHIAELPIRHDGLKRFLAFNVNMETFVQMKKKMQDCFAELDEMGRKNPGNMLIAGSFVVTRVFDDEGA